MKKILASASGLTLAAAIGISWFGDGGTGLHLLFSTEALHNGIRVATIIGLICMVLTAAPRSKLVRGALSIAATIATASALYFVFANTLLFGDALLYLLSAVVLMMEAIEEVPVPVASAHQTSIAR